MSCRAILGPVAAAAAAVLLLWSLGPGPRAADEPKPKKKPVTATDLVPKTVTLPADKLTVAEALSKIAEQTGIKVEDRRENAEDVKIKLALTKAPFFQAVEEVAKAADARVSLYQMDYQVALVDGPYRAAPLSFSGIFRVGVKRLSAHRDLETDAHFYTAQLEVAWEPGFKPFFLETRPQSLVVKDDRMRDLENIEENTGRLPIEGRTALIDVRLPPTPRTTAKLGLLKGNLALIGPSKWLTFTFEDLGKLKADPKLRQQTKEGVSMNLSKLKFDKDLWTIEVTLDYPADGPKFESFESWLVYNEMTLKRGDVVFPSNGGSETGDSAGNQAIVSYFFVDEPGKKLVRGEPDKWDLTYSTPGPIIEVPVAFEFKDLILP